MKIIASYVPPSPEALAGLKTSLKFTSPQMASIAGLAQGGQWRKYTGAAAQRNLSLQMHFYIAAMLTLSEADKARVVETMREQGALVDVGDLLPVGR